MQNMSIFDDGMLYQHYKVNKKLRVVEFFAGIGSQCKAIENLSKKGLIPNGFEHYKICEWAIPSIIAYASIHREYLKNYGTDFTKDLSKEQVASKLFELGVSQNYNDPCNYQQLLRMNEEWFCEITAREIFKVYELPNNEYSYAGYHNELIYEPCYNSFEEAKAKVITLGSGLVKNLDNVLLRDEIKHKAIENQIEILKQNFYLEKENVVLPNDNGKSKDLAEDYLTGGIFDFM